MIEASFLWTDEQAVIANRYHQRYTCRRPFRIAANGIAILAITGGVFRLSRFGLSLLPVGLIVGGLYWIFLRRYDMAWTVKRRFNKRPDKDKQVKWHFSPEGVDFETENLGSGRVKWDAFTKAVKTPVGYLLYPNDQMYHWLPTVALKGDVKEWACK